MKRLSLKTNTRQRRPLTASKGAAAGFSTLELIITFAILTITIVAVTMVTFGNQSTAIDTELSQRGLYLSKQKLEAAGAATLENFDAVESDISPAAFDSTFDTQLTVTPISDCAKTITSESFWNRDLRNLKNSLSATFIDPYRSQALLGDCAATPPSDDWDNPDVFVDVNITGQSQATAIDEFNHFVYLTTAPEAANKNDFFIYEFDETGVTLTKRGEQNTSSAFNAGLNDVDVAGDYAFVASASTSDQLQVIDVSDPANPNILWTLNLPGVDPDGSYPAATTIYYYNNRVYVGTAETDGPELHIFDVSADLATNPPVWLGSLELTHNVNDIVVSGTLAYLATSDNNHELMVIDVSDPTNLTHPDVTNLGYDAPGNNDGSAVHVAADRVYLGRFQKNPPTDSFYILTRTATIDGTSVSDGLLGAHSIGLQNNTYVSGLRVSGRFAFLALDDPTTGLVIYDITDPQNIALPAACSAFNFSENTVGIDNDNTSKYLFVANGSNDEIRIIYDQDTACNP